MKNLINEPLMIFLILFLIVISIFSYNNLLEKNQNQKNKDLDEIITTGVQNRFSGEESSHIPEPTETFTGNEVMGLSGLDEANTGILKDKVEFNINEDCSYSGEGYKHFDIIEKDFYTPKEPNYQLYSKLVNLDGNIEDAYICIISNIRPNYKIYKAYYFSTYVYFGDEENAGHLNAAFSLEKQITYDNSSDKSIKLDGKFYGHEAPFGYIVNLKKVTVSDKENGGFKYIFPLKLLNQNKSLKIGGFVNSYPNYWAGYIQKYRIIYKGGSLTVKK